MTRNRIVGHRTVKASDMIPHELNPRTHSGPQREALRDLLGEVGFSRSTLAYVADEHRHLGATAPLTLIDGHLRCEELGGGEVTVEVLDVNDEEARKLLLSIDPLSSLAGYERAALDELTAVVRTSSDALANLWSSIADAQEASSRVMEAARRGREREGVSGGPERFLVIIECSGEKGQAEALKFCKSKGYDCKAVVT